MTENACFSWVCSPATRKGIGLLTAAAQGGAAGILDLGTVGPSHWGAVAENIRLLQQYYPATQALGIRLPVRHLAHFLHAFPLHKERRLFFVLTGFDASFPDEAAAELKNHAVYVEVGSRTELDAAIGISADQDVQLVGCVAASAENQDSSSPQSAFILAQAMLDAPLPVWLKGGIGIHAAAAIQLAGIRGVVLDSQVLLFTGSPLRPDEVQRLSKVDAQDFQLIGEECGTPLLMPNLPWAGAAARLLQDYEAGLRAGALDQLPPLVAAARDIITFGDPDSTIWPIGPVVALAPFYLRQYRTLPAFLQALERTGMAHLASAGRHSHLHPTAALAQSHGTRYAVVQGPMTRVCDTPAFAQAVADTGALPFVALALLTGPALTDLLAQSAERLQDRLWGTGMLGFLPDDLREEQVAAVISAKPAFALIAGGTIGQAQRLESAGIATYLHVPSPAILRLFLENGGRRFIFEGRECGGHVGPTASFLLWEQMIETLLETLPEAEFSSLHILFAGGIHDALSSAMVAVCAAPLSERGARTGILMGTAYLACQEAVESGALTEVFQQQVFEQTETTLLVSALGHANRCIDTSFAREFKALRAGLLAKQVSGEEITTTLDRLLLGRLRIATKGIQRGDSARYEAVDPQTILDKGMFMVGDVVRFIASATSCAELHLNVTEGGLARLANYAVPAGQPEPQELPADIAIVGMSTIVPGSDHLERFWATILERTRHLKEVPAERWDWRVLMSESLPAKDRITSAWGGFIDDILFDPLKYGIPPKSVPNIASAQLLGLELVSRALKDAQMETEHMDRENTSVIFATADAGGFLANALTVRSTLPFLAQQATDEAQQRTPEWTEETFAGILCNVVPGRISNRLDFGGRNFAVDAACASSLVAVDLGVRELLSHRSNVVIVGGVDVGQTPFGYLAFSNTGALSPTGQSVPFDQRGDGIVISEGGAVLVLKRLADAERDGDRIYSVIKGIAGSSDGRAMGLTAPRSEGQQLALQRAYREAGFQPHQIGFYEAHGTGTPVGDKEELQTICKTLAQDGAAPQSVILSSVKSLIGHTKMASGMVSLAKTALALYYKVLPTQSELQQPIALLTENACPLAVHHTPAPWLDPERTGRKAGVSAFGFGGANFHAVLQEHEGYAASRKLGADAWPCELLVFGAEHQDALLAELRQLADDLRHPLELSLRDLAFSLAARCFGKAPALRLSFACASLQEAQGHLKVAIEALQSGGKLPAAIAFGQPAVAEGPKVAFLFPGQGSQYLHMGQELALYFPEFRAEAEGATRLLSAQYPQAFWRYLFPPHAFGQLGQQQEAELKNTHVAQPAIGLHSVAMLDLLVRLGIQPGFVAGHSFGEFTALHAAGVFSRADFYRLAEFRGRVMNDMATGEGTMLAVFASRAEVEAQIAATGLAVAIANHNTPNQVAVSGSTTAIEAAARHFAIAGLSCMRLPVSAAFHSPLMKDAAQPLADKIRATSMSDARLPVFSNQSGKPYSASAAAVQEQLSEHLLGTVEFVRQVEEMQAAGVRIFLEVGPGEVLTKLTRQCLTDSSCVALSLDSASGSLQHLLATLGTLWTMGLPVDISQLFADRTVQLLPLASLRRACAAREQKPTDWWINGHLPKPVNPAFAAYSPDVLRTIDSSNPTINDMAINNHDLPAAHPGGLPDAGDLDLTDTQAALPADTMLAVYQAYQDTMRQFLKTQESVMQVLLTGQAADASPQSAAWIMAPPAPLPTVAAAPVAAAPKPRPAAVSELAPGKAPIVREPAIKPAAPGPKMPAAAAPDFSLAGIQRLLVELVSDRTGYPPDMIQPDMDMEKDLGVDSIKRMEIVGKFLKLAPPALVGELNGKADKFVRIKRLRELSELLATAMQGTGELTTA